MVRSRSKEARALSADEVRRQEVDVLFMTWLVARSTEGLVDAALAPAGLTGDEFAIYSVLAAGEVTTPSEMARWMAAPATTVSSYIQRLERRGHVARDPNPDDRRSYRLRLTPEGRQQHTHAAELFQPIRSGTEAALGTNLDAVEAALLVLRAAVDDMRSTSKSTTSAGRQV